MEIDIVSGTVIGEFMSNLAYIYLIGIVIGLIFQKITKSDLGKSVAYALIGAKLSSILFMFIFGAYEQVWIIASISGSVIGPILYFDKVE